MSFVKSDKKNKEESSVVTSDTRGMNWNQKYFNKYRIDIEKQKSDAIASVREFAQSMIDKSITEPSLAEIRNILPTHLSIEKINTYKDLSDQFKYEIRCKKDKFCNSENKIKKLWNESQKIFINWLKFNGHSAYKPQLLPQPQLNALVVNLESLINNPNILNHFTIDENIKHKGAIENFLKSQIDELPNLYKEDLNEFLSTWKKFRECDIKLSHLNQTRQKEIQADARKQFESIETQYVEMKQQINKVELPKQIQMRITCNHGQFQFAENKLINVRPEIKIYQLVDAFLKKHVSLKYNPKIFDLKVVIKDGPEMASDSYLCDYNLPLIEEMRIIFVQKVLPADENQNQNEEGVSNSNNANNDHSKEVASVNTEKFPSF